MNNYLSRYKSWFEQRSTRERLFLLLLSFAIIYGLFALLLFRPVENKLTQLNRNLKDVNDQIETWHLQIAAVKKLSETPLYKEWQSQHKSLLELEDKYKAFLQSSSNEQWKEVINTLLQPQNNITLAQIKNSPESTYNPLDKLSPDTKIYQQKIELTVYGNFFDILAYLERLEKLLPNVHWNGLKYEVLQYPSARVDMEFSIFYERPF